jgi:hypothetical protein
MVAPSEPQAACRQPEEEEGDMRRVQIRSRTKRLIAGGALLTVCAVGGTVTTAHASWSDTTKPSTWFLCLENCKAGGIGPVDGGAIVEPNSSVPNRSIGAWTRTVLIHCKGTSHSGDYQVTVKDRNWEGLWMIAKPNLSRKIDDSSFPTC